MVTATTAAGKAAGFCAAKRTKSDWFYSTLLTLALLFTRYSKVNMVVFIMPDPRPFFGKLDIILQILRILSFV